MKKLNFLSSFQNSKLVMNFVSTLLGSGTSKFILTIATFLFANMLTKMEFGEFSFVRNTLNTILCVCALNFTALCTKFTVESKCEIAAFNKLIYVFLFSFCVSVLTGFFLIFSPDSLLLSFLGSPTVVFSFRIIGVLLPLFLLQPLIEGVLRGLMMFKLIGILQTVSALFFVLIIWEGIKSQGVNGALIGIIIYYTVYAVISVIVLYKKFPIRSLWTNIGSFIKEKNVLHKMIIPIFFMSFFEAPVMWVAQVLLSKFGSMEAIGSMMAIMQIKNLVILIPMYFASTFLVFAGELNARKDYLEYFRKIDRFVFLFLVAGLILVLILSVSSKFILSLYGSSYVSDWFVLVISNLGIPVIMLINLFRIDLILQEHQDYLFYISIAWNSIWLISLFVFLKLGIPALESFFYSQLLGWGFNLLGYYFVYYRDKKSLLRNF